MNKRNIFTLFAILFSTNVFANDTTLTKVKGWYVPDYTKVQFAGNIGLVSVGFGYQFLNNHLYSELLYGYVPASISKAEVIHTITIKNTFPILNKEYKAITLSPITGFTASFETGNNSFLKLHNKYPSGYYGTNAFHLTLFIGAKAHKDFMKNSTIKGVDLYFEVGSVDTYIWYVITEKEVQINQIFSSAIGINIYF
jgi:hypothetical protein